MNSRCCWAKYQIYIQIPVFCAIAQSNCWTTCVLEARCLESQGAKSLCWRNTQPYQGKEVTSFNILSLEGEFSPNGNSTKVIAAFEFTLATANTNCREPFHPHSQTTTPSELATYGRPDKGTVITVNCCVNVHQMYCSSHPNMGEQTHTPQPTHRDAEQPPYMVELFLEWN